MKVSNRETFACRKCLRHGRPGHAYPAKTKERCAVARFDLGFTLMEVMITVVIVGVLAAIAIPSYNSFVTRGRIPEATGPLAAKRVEMEQYFQDNRSYVGAPACNSDTTTSRYFTFSCSGSPTASAFTLLAVGTGMMQGFTYTIDQSGSKATTSVPAGWDLPSPNSCWVTNKGGVC